MTATRARQATSPTGDASDSADGTQDAALPTGVPTAERNALRIDGVSLAYGDAEVVHAMSLSVSHGETVAILGPSGSGKTTVLHAVAGFLDPVAGSIAIDGGVVADPNRALPPERRDVGMVFQSYALWPHLSALDNVAYPLRRRGLDSRTARAEAAELLDRLGLRRVRDRWPAELSGGEQQRVGLARALARRPTVFLLDEPTAHLDADLRGRLQQEIVEQRARSSAAAVYATHDVTEALAVADRIAIMREGSLVQVGTPVEVYGAPVDVWAAGLTGPVSILDVRVAGRPDGRASVTLPDDALTTPQASRAGPGHGETAEVLVRPEWARFGGPLSGIVKRVDFHGSYTDHVVTTAAGDLIIRTLGGPAASAGSTVTWSLDRVHLVPGATEPAATD